VYRRFPTPEAWKRHTRGAATRGLSSAALACLGSQPRAVADPASFTGFYGVVTVLRSDLLEATGLVAEAVGYETPIPVVTIPAGAQVYAPISRRAARELAHPKRIPATPSNGPTRTPAYDAIMRPTARARQRADAILSEA
jgi:hypothetical protein